MKRLFLYSVLGAVALSCVPAAEAKKRHYRYDRDNDYRYRDRTRTVYVIENRRPVRRVVYVAPGGGYYRIVDGRRSYIRGRYYNSYPSRYYYSDGRPRVGVSLSF